MKKNKGLFVLSTLGFLCIPLAKIIIDTGDAMLIKGADAKITAYTVRLDSTNTPAELTSTPIPSGSWFFANPSRSVKWLYGEGVTSYTGAHLALTGLNTMRDFGSHPATLITGVISMTLDWTALNGLVNDDIAVLLCTPAAEGGMDVANFIRLGEFTSPHTFTRTDFSYAYSSASIALQIQSSAENAVFVLNSLEIVYDCVPID